MKAAYLSWSLILLGACQQEEPPDTWAGYLEGDYRYLAPAVSGRLTTLAVTEGDKVRRGQTLFTLDSAREQAALAAAHAQQQALLAQSEDMASGQRDEEIARLQAQLAQAQANAKLAATERARVSKLVKSRAVSASTMDKAEAQYRMNNAKVSELQAALRIARLPARSAQREQIAAQIRAAEADIAAREWQLAQTRVQAPDAGKIVRVFYHRGEWVASGRPVLALLPDGAIKAIFYVPEDALPRISLGQSVQLSCPGCPPLGATIRHIADRPEYTPPVLYSENSQYPLSYRLEATLDNESAALHPGQPVTAVLP